MSYNARDQRKTLLATTAPQISSGTISINENSPSSYVLGKWESPNDFRFHSAKSERAWITNAYRQGVHHDNWVHGTPVDERTADLIRADLAGGVSAFRGPDGQFRMHNFKTIEDSNVIKIKAQNLKGRTPDDIHGVSLPGEVDALKYVLGKKGAIGREGLLESINRTAGRYASNSQEKAQQPPFGKLAAGVLPPMDTLLPPANDNYCPIDPEQDEACKEIYEELLQLRAEIFSGHADDTSDEAKAAYNRAATYYNESCVPFGHPELPLF